MKKILLSLVCAVTGMVAIAQDFTITGTVVNQSGTPIPNHEIFITADSSVFSYYNTVYTDANGNYTDIITNGAQIGPNINYFVWAYDYCSPNGNWLTHTLSNNQGTITSGIANFVVCDSVQTNCSAYFYTYGTNPGTYQFVDYSSGSNLTFAWDFGDGNTSTLQYPVHTYANYGTYTVCLTITGTNGCTNTSCMTLNYSTVQCQANFTVVNIDTTTNTVDLVENSTTSNTFTNYFWDFGDGNTSTAQWPSHTYGSAGIYYVCLTISDSSFMQCTSTYCDSIGVSQFMVDGSRSGFTINVYPPLAASVEEISTISEIQLFPNPANENVTLNYTALTAGTHQISITDISGKLISTDNFAAQKGVNQKQISLTEINAGIYLVTITDENGNANHLRLIKE